MDWLSFATGAVAAVMFLVVAAHVGDVDTVKDITERGYYHLDGQLYVVRPADAVEVAQ